LTRKLEIVKSHS